MTGPKNSTFSSDEIESRAVEEIEPLKSIDKELFNDISKILPKPTCEWTENDFPDLPNHADSALNRLLQAYSRSLSRFSASERVVEDTDIASISLLHGSTLGLLLKIGILVGDVIFVAYAIEVRRLQTEADVTLLSLMVVLGLITVFYLIFFVLMRNPKNLVSLIGIVAMVLMCMLISVHPDRIKWQPVMMGFFLQFTFAVLTLQTKVGYTIFEFIGAQTTALMDNSKVGASFVFGDLFLMDCFAIKVLPLVVFFSSFISIMFHLGWVQQFLIQPSNFIRNIMGTTGPETVNAITNIFLSMNEAPLLIKPYMSQMTNSELHAIMVNGFASIAGPVMVVYINFGIPANHLLIACVMSAPAALAIAKILYPETKQAPLAKGTKNTLHSSPFTNPIEAATVGALEAIPLCAGIIVNLMAFLSIFSVFNRILTWLGHRVGMVRDLTFELIFAYLLWPLAFGMGVPAEDCFKVGELVGIKTVLSEFIAFERLGQLIRDSSIYDSFHNKSLPVKAPNEVTFNPLGIQKVASRKTIVITSYALCGFANVGSVGILLGTFIKMLPHRRKDLSGMVVHGMIGGTIAAFVTACFAGLLYDPNL
ncbi:Solute carrier family 28 member 3 [Taenia crassiceps]|uniref:Solute carrier family 28 member 3 n=1 Tax=Taenia crassiceps TaxID=6207 RepID=A0ABR4QIL9_9CEST